MAGFFSRFRRAAKTAVNGSGPGAYRVGDTMISCGQCDNEWFEEGQALLNTAGMTFFNLDWANRTATILTCANCGHIMWFLREPERVHSAE